MAEPTEPENKTKALSKVETSVCGLVLNNLEDMKTVAQLILQSKLAPPSFDTAEKIFVGLQTGAEIGLKPMQALNSIVVIKGKPTLWGDAALALVKKSGLLDEFTEEVTGEGDDMVAFVKSVRGDDNFDRLHVVETTFSVADAKTAGLWKKPGPWTTHPKRMLKYKARAFNLRDNFPDVLFGMHMTEEMYDEEPLPAPESDVKPRDKRRMAVPSTAVDTTRAPVEEQPKLDMSTFQTMVQQGDNMPLQETKKEVEQGPEEPGADEAIANEQAAEQQAAERPANDPMKPTELVTFVCKECGQTFRFGKEEGKGVQCECGKGILEQLENLPETADEPTIEEKGDLAALYIEVNGMYVAQNGKDFIEFAAYVLCLDESEVSPSKLTEDQLKQIKAYIETSGVEIN